MTTNEHIFRHFRNLESAQLIITAMLEKTNCIFKEFDACRHCGHEVHYSAEICPICNTKAPHSTIYGHLTFYDNKFFEDERAKRRRYLIWLSVLAALLVILLLSWLLFGHLTRTPKQ